MTVTKLREAMELAEERTRNARVMASRPKVSRDAIMESYKELLAAEEAERAAKYAYYAAVDEKHADAYGVFACR